MRSKDQTRTFAEIAEIRALQCLAAETATGRAARILRAKDDQRAECELHCASAAQNWDSAMSAPSLALEVSKLWSVDLLRHEREAARAASDAKAAAQALERCS